MIDPILNIDDRQKSKLTSPYVASPQVKRLLKTIADNHGKGVLVGGCVRDHLMGHEAKDIDIEVYGLDSDTLESLLSKYFSVVAVGKSFGIFKVTITLGNDRATIDVALPRSENKLGQGHKGFVVATDPRMSFVEAARRRDFTINAMGIDVDAQELLDPHGGLLDLTTRRLRHVSDAFKEDPLRVLRAAQFCARFDLTIDEDTVDLCKSLREELFTLSKERVYEEFKKLLLAKKPSIGLTILRRVEALVIFPELSALIDCAQDPEWHPEGDVWTHSLMVADEAAKIIRQSLLSEEEQLIVMAGALSHDLGKPAVTIPKDGRIKSPGHEQAGVAPTIAFLESIGFPKKWHDDVTSLVKDHLKPHQLFRTRDEVSDGAIRRLACRVNIDRLLMVAKADFLGRTTPDALSGLDPSEEWLRNKVKEVLGADITPKPILLGRHLIALGEKPGAHFTAILDAAFEAQLDGAFTDEAGALSWLKAYLKARP